MIIVSKTQISCNIVWTFKKNIAEGCPQRLSILAPAAVFNGHWRELCVVRRSAGVSSKASAAVTQRAAAGRPKRCGTSHAHIWASNAGQDTTLDTLQKALILSLLWPSPNLVIYSLNKYMVEYRSLRM